MAHRSLVFVLGVAGIGVAAYVGFARDARTDTTRSHPGVAPSVGGSAGVAPSVGGSAGVARDPGRQVFIDAVAGFARGVARDRSPACPEPPVARSSWPVAVAVHHRGVVVGRGESSTASLCDSLREATERAVGAAALEAEQIAQARLVIALAEALTIAEHGGTGRELVEGVVAVRSLTAGDVARQIERGKRYLFGVIDPERGGVHKFYRATEDRLEPQLHTIYSASMVFTLIRMYEREPDPELAARIASVTQFLLTMQASQERVRGAFHYSLSTEDGRRDDRFVVGTTSKTIFTLLMLHDIATGADSPLRDRVLSVRPDEPGGYLGVARRAADWLTTMQRRDGSVRSYVRLADTGKWVRGRKRSLLYTGQVLSALSRIYTVTREGRYVDAADLTARHLISIVDRDGCYLGDDYRRPNPISTSWTILSLLDFHRATGDARAGEIALRCADELLTRQLDVPTDAYRHGRWRRSLSSSGNGWLAEVYAELHGFCRERGLAGCERFQRAITRSVRLILQHVYSDHGAYVAAAPERALGGVFWNAAERYVRTDSVCHALNAFVAIAPHLGEGELLSLPEPALAEQLADGAAPPASDRASPASDRASPADGEEG